jgi:hypothetical protein
MKFNVFEGGFSNHAISTSKMLWKKDQRTI